MRRRLRLATDGTRAIGNSTIGIWGYVHLAYNPSTGVNCVVARKTRFHGVRSTVEVYLTVQGVDGVAYNGSQVMHWESVKRQAAGRCVQYLGRIWDPTGPVREGRSGGRQTWGNCG